MRSSPCHHRCLSLARNNICRKEPLPFLSFVLHHSHLGLRLPLCMEILPGLVCPSLRDDKNILENSLAMPFACRRRLQMHGFVRVKLTYLHILSPALPSL